MNLVVTIGADHIALFNLFQNPFEAYAPISHIGNPELLLFWITMMKLQTTRFILAAIQTRLGSTVF